MDGEPAPKRIRLNTDDLERLSKDDLIMQWKKQEAYITAVENKTDLSDHNAAKLSEMEDRLHQQQNEFAQKERKDRLLVMRLATKEQELQELANQLTEMTKGQAPGSAQLRSALLDPALNLIFQRMRKELEDKTKALQQAQDDMSAWKFTADSQMGKRLMSRCRTLIQENQDLGTQVSAGRTARLETELALQKKYSEELKGSQDELNDFVIELDEEVVGMQSTICALQQQLKEAKQELSNVKTPKPADSSSAAAVPEEPMAVDPVLPPPTMKEEPKPVVNEERTSEPPASHQDKSRTEQRTNQEEAAQAFTEPATRQCPSELSQSMLSSSSWTSYDVEGETTAEKSPSTPTEEEAFRIPEAPRTIKMEPTSLAIPDEASSGPGPDEEARTSVSVKEEPMEVDTIKIKAEKPEEERTFQVSPQEPEEQVNNRTTDGEAAQSLPASVDSNSTPEEDGSNQRTQGREEPPAEPNQVAPSEDRTPENQNQTAAVPEPTKAAQETDIQVKVEVEAKQQVEVKKEKLEQESSNQEALVDTKQISNSSSTSPQWTTEDGNKADVAPINTTSNGNARTEPDQVSSSDASSTANPDNTKNGEFPLTHSQSPDPASSDKNNEVESNCKSSNSPSSNNIEDAHPSQTSPKKTNEETVPNNESSPAATGASNAPPVDSAATDRTVSPVKQIIVKSNDGDGVVVGEGEVGNNKQKNVDDVPPLKENGPEVVSN